VPDGSASNRFGGTIQTLKKRLKIGIVDLIARQPTKSIYARIVNPNYSSITPQFVAVWAEQLGHEVHFVSYTGFENLYRELPQDVDVVFVSTFTQAAYTAYAISNIFRKKNVVTVLGGPHARAYAEDAMRYFDYVMGMTDKELIADLLANLEPQPEGKYLTASQQPKSVPSVRERWKFVQKNLEKTWIVHVVPMIGSLGCPYTCSFCIDSGIDYQTLSYDQIRDDLHFLQGLPKPPIVSWYDPNFGVRFNEYMDLIESVVPPGRMAFGGESSLSLLSEPNLKRLKKNNFIVMLPGIESWFAYNDKSKQMKSFGENKLQAVADQVNTIVQYIPYVQTNFIFGLDTDFGTEPFELTKKFVDLVPGVYPNYALITSFGNSAPLNTQYQSENRVLDLPFPFLDGNFGLNVRPKNYSYVEFYDHVVDLFRYSFSNSKIIRRFRSNWHPLPRWMNVLRARFSSRGSCGNFAEIRNLLATNPEFQAFYAGDTQKPPMYYREKTKSVMGVFYDHLPESVLRQLENGEEAPNPRISNAVVQNGRTRLAVAQ
jgi:hypothetical protein